MATPEPTTATPSNGSSPETDKDFDPSADMLVHDFDDEQTLEEEENLSGGESVAAELNVLEKEGDMPIEQLLAMYGYGPPATGSSSSSNSMSPDDSQGQDTRSSSEEEILSNQDLTLDKDEIARDLLSNSENEDKETDVHHLLETVASSQTARLLRSHSQPGSEDSDSEADVDYKPLEEDWKKTISVGSSYQAVVPEGLCKYGDAPAYENEDRLLWDPSKMEDTHVEKYLEEIHMQCVQSATGVNAIPTGAHVRDDEQALYLLLQCGHNKEEALRRRKMQVVPPTDPMSLWSEEECGNFETGLRFYGKDFYLIHQNKVRTRSVGELVQFYYLWKKTERHDIFANKTRLEKRRYTLHPGVTDYMERFMYDGESGAVCAPPHDASPVHTLLYGDTKRHHLKPQLDQGAGPTAALPSTQFQPILSEININTGTPTVTCPETKIHNQTSQVDSYSNHNGVPEQGYSPAFKKSRLEASGTVCNPCTDLHSTTASTDTQHHIDSLSKTSVVSRSEDSMTVDSLTPVTNSVEPVALSSVQIPSSRNMEAVSQ